MDMIGKHFDRRVCDLLGGAEHIAGIATEIASREPGDEHCADSGGDQADKPAGGSGDCGDCGIGRDFCSSADYRCR